MSQTRCLSRHQSRLAHRQTNDLNFLHNRPIKNACGRKLTWWPFRLKVDSADGGPITEAKLDGWPTVPVVVGVEMDESDLGSSLDRSPVDPSVPRGSLPSPLAELVDPDLRRSLLHHFQSGWALKWASLTYWCVDVNIDWFGRINNNH